MIPTSDTTGVTLTELLLRFFDRVFRHLLVLPQLLYDLLRIMKVKHKLQCIHFHLLERRLSGGQRLRYKYVDKRKPTWRLLHTIHYTILKKIYHSNTNMITISAMVFLMFLPLSYPVSTAGEALHLKLVIKSKARTLHETLH